MDILNEEEIEQLVGRSKIAKKYNELIDRESAYELLNKKFEEVAQAKENDEIPKSKEEKSTLETILSSSVTRQIGRTAANIITRSLLGALGIGSSKKRTSWF